MDISNILNRSNPDVEKMITERHIQQLESLVKTLEETQIGIGKDLAQALRYFLERYGITPPEITHVQNEYRRALRITREGLTDMERESQH